MSSKVRVLVIDDDDEHIEVLKACARACDEVELRIIETKEQIRSEVAKWDPTVVLIDAHTRTVSAVELLARELSTQVQVVITSRNNSAAIEEWAKREGAAGYFPSSGDAEGVGAFLEELILMSDEVTKH